MISSNYTCTGRVGRYIWDMFEGTILDGEINEKIGAQKQATKILPSSFQDEARRREKRDRFEI